MLTSDDLKKLRLVIREEVDKRVEETEVKMEHRFNAVDKRFNTVDQRFDTVDKRFEGIDIQLANLEKHMEQDRKDWSTFFNEAGIFFDEMRSQLSKRIKKLEDNQRVSKN